MSSKYVDRQYFNKENLKYWLKKPFKVSAYFSYGWIITERVPAWACLANDLIYAIPVSILIFLVFFIGNAFGKLYLNVASLNSMLGILQMAFFMLCVGFIYTALILAIPIVVIGFTYSPFIKKLEIMHKITERQITKAIKNNNSLKEKFNVHDALAKQDEKVKPYLIKAEDFEKSGQYDKAVDMYYKVLDMDLNNGYAYGMLARLLYYLKRYREAIHVYDDLCLNLNCIDEAIAFRAYINRDNCWLRTADYVKVSRNLSIKKFRGEAIEILSAASQNTSDIDIKMKALIQLAYIGINTGEYKQLNEINKILKNVANSTDSIENMELVCILECKMYLIVNDREQAVKYLTCIMEDNGYYADLITSKVESLLLKKNRK